MPWLNCGDRRTIGSDRTFMFAQTQWSTNMCERLFVRRVTGVPQCAWRCDLSDRRADGNIVVGVFVLQNIFVPSMHSLAGRTPGFS
jgi:hypothetical protein